MNTKRKLDTPTMNEKMLTPTKANRQKLFAIIRKFIADEEEKRFKKMVAAMKFSRSLSFTKD